MNTLVEFFSGMSPWVQADCEIHGHDDPGCGV